jgi:hypothetical protein
MKAGWISLAALGLVAAVAATPANGANNHHHHNGHHHGHKVKGVIVNVDVSVDFIHRVDDTFKNQNGGCGSGDPEEDFDPVETHTAATATWTETFKHFAIVPGSTDTTTATPILSSTGWQNQGFGYEDVNDPGGCRSASEKIPWDCHGTLDAVDDSATLAGTTKASEKTAFRATLGRLTFSADPTECGSASTFEGEGLTGDPSQYIDPNHNLLPILDQLTYTSTAKPATFVISPDEFDRLVKGHDLGHDSTGELPALPFLADCNHTDNAVVYGDTCSQVFGQDRSLVVHPVKVIYR